MPRAAARDPAPHRGRGPRAARAPRARRRATPRPRSCAELSWRRLAGVQWRHLPGDGPCPTAAGGPAPDPGAAAGAARAGRPRSSAPSWTSAPPSVPRDARRAVSRWIGARPGSPAESVPVVPAPAGRGRGAGVTDHARAAARASSWSTTSAASTASSSRLRAAAPGGTEGFEASPTRATAGVGARADRARHARLRRPEPGSRCSSAWSSPSTRPRLLGAGQRRGRPAAGRGDRPAPARLHRGVPDPARAPPDAEHRIGLRPLVRTVHGRRLPAPGGAGAAAAGRAVAGAGHDPRRAPGRLGAALDRRRPGRHARPTSPAAARPGRADVARWAAAPLTLAGRRRQPLAARRARARRRSDRAPPPPAPGPRRREAPAGYLWPGPDEDFLHELFAAVHPVTGDQLVTPWPNRGRRHRLRRATSIGCGGTPAGS